MNEVTLMHVESEVKDRPTAYISKILQFPIILIFPMKIAIISMKDSIKGWSIFANGVFPICTMHKFTHTLCKLETAYTKMDHP